MKNIKLVISYDGSRYFGWQRLGGDQRRQSIQGYLEEVLEQVLGTSVHLSGSGRTDAGVHAKGQVANFHVPSAFLRKWRETCRTKASELEVVSWEKVLQRQLNERLPKDICILEIEQVDKQFHSRFSAVRKTYEYRVDTREVPNVFSRKYALWVEKSLDLKTMQEAAELFVGTHDFTSFTTRAADSKKKRDMVRTIYSFSVEKVGDEIVFTVCGDGFLYNMVRIMVGTLLEVGEGSRIPQQILEALKQKNRQSAGKTISSVGLCLKEVKYK